MAKPTHLNFTYSQIDPSSLVESLKEFYDFKSVDVYFFNQGFSDIYSVSAPDGKYVFRIYSHNWKDLKDIEGEVELLMILHQNKVPVSQPILGKSGDSICAVNYPEGIRYGILFPFATGKALPHLDAENSFLFGKHLAGIHQITKDREIKKLSRKYEPAELLSDTIEIVKERIGKTEAHSKLKAICDTISKELSSSILEGLSKGICHGDPHYENVFLDSVSGSMTFFDFDFCGNGYLHYDLGSFFHYERTNQQNKEKFIEGYCKEITLSEKDLALIPCFEVLMRLFHLGARIKNADGIKNPIWPDSEILETIEKIGNQVGDLK